MVKIIQLLCPKRHCIMATVYECEQEDPVLDARLLSEFEQEMAHLFSNQVLHAHCGICGSDNFRYEIQRTKYKTLAYCEEHLEACQADQIASRALMDKLGLSHDAQKNQSHEHN